MTDKITTRLTKKYECIAKLKSETDAFSSRRADEILRELPFRAMTEKFTSRPTKK